MTEQKEIWRDIENYEGFYQVSNLGRVKKLNYRNTQRERILRPSLSSGYKRIALIKNQRKKYYFVHRLVAQGFIPNPDNKTQINHISGEKTDNRVENLEWVTAKENIKHAIRTELIRRNGQDSSRAKLTNEQARKIREEYIPRHKDFGERVLAQKYGVSIATIQRIVKNKRYKE